MPIPAALVASAPAIGAVASSLITSASNFALSERQRQQNEKYQNQMNEYNSPEEQMKRLKDAGISPNAYMTGNGKLAEGNTSAPINPYQLPSISDPFGQAASSLLNYSKAKTEDKMLSVRIAEAQANIENLNASVRNLGVSSDYQSILNEYAAAMQQNAINESKARTQESYYNIAVSRQVARKYQYEIDNIMPEELKKIVSERNVNILRLDEILATIDNFYADTNLKQTQSAEVQQKTELESAQTEGQHIENSNAQEIANQVIAQYKAMIEKLSAETGKTTEETFWLLFDEIDKNSISIFGNKIPANRFSTKDVRNKFGQAIEDRFRNMGPRVYYPNGNNYR